MYLRIGGKLIILKISLQLKGTTEEVLNERRQLEELQLTLAEERERCNREKRIMRSDMVMLRNSCEQMR